MKEKHICELNIMFFYLTFVYEHDMKQQLRMF